MNQVPDWGQVAALVVAGVFLLMSGLVSASEAAFFSLLPSDVQVLKDSARQRDRMLVSLLGRSDRMLTSLQIADVFLNVGFVALCAYGLDAWIDGASSPAWWLVAEVVGLTLLLVNLGEILPKVLARRNALAGVRRMAVVLAVTYRVVAPFTNIVVRYTAAVNRRMERKKKELSVDDLSQALEMTAPEVKEEKEMLSEIIKFYNKTADEIMTPRMDIYGLDVSTKYQEVVEHVVKSGYSRIPVFERSEDHIKGILYAKDLFPHLNEAEDYAWQGLLRPAYFVPETKKIDDLLDEFRANKVHMAIVVDEFGATSGIVTLEDILEEIVGDIADEYDDDEQQYIRLANGSYIFEAKIPLTDFFRVTELQPEYFDGLAEEPETLAGLLLEIKDDFPERREVIEYKDCRFQILEVDNRRIRKVKYSRKEVPEEA